MRFEWDEAQNVANRLKHGVSFEEAQELFTPSGDYLEIFDADHSDLEELFIAIGPIVRGIVLVVWTERDEETTRIISARWANPREQSLYQTHRNAL